MVQHAALLDSSSAGLWSAVHNERPDMAARSSAMNFFLAGCSCAVPVGNPLAPVFAPSWNALQNAWASGRAQHIQGATFLTRTHPTRSPSSLHTSSRPIACAARSHSTRTCGQSGQCVRGCLGQLLMLTGYLCMLGATRGRSPRLPFGSYTLRPYGCTYLCAFCVSRARLECLSW